MKMGRRQRHTHGFRPPGIATSGPSVEFSGETARQTASGACDAAADGVMLWRRPDPRVLSKRLVTAGPNGSGSVLTRES